LPSKADGLPAPLFTQRLDVTSLASEVKHIRQILKAEKSLWLLCGGERWIIEAVVVISVDSFEVERAFQVSINVSGAFSRQLNLIICQSISERATNEDLKLLISTS
jgi:hypothetical protein